MLGAGNNKTTNIKIKFSLLIRVSYNNLDALVGTSESLMLTTIIIFFLMVHCVVHDNSSNIQKIEEEVLGISQKSNKSLTTHSNIHGSYCKKKSVRILRPIYINISFKEKVLILCIVSSMR